MPLKAFWSLFFCLLVFQPIQLWGDTRSRSSSTAEIFRSLKKHNSTGRSGMYYLPENYKLRRLPVMLLLHGSSINGRAIANLFKALARKRHFIIIAPDSVNTFGWEYSTDLTDPTEDETHIYNCLSEVLALPRLRVKSGKLLVAGVSAGAEVAAFLGSNDTQFNSLAVLHGGVYVSAIGSNVIPAWLSTGSLDTLRTPIEVSAYKGSLNEKGFQDVVYKEYEAGHEIIKEERQDFIKWWLNGER